MANIPATLGNDLFRAADAFDVDHYTTYLDPDVRFQFGNAEPITGRENVRQTVREFFTTIKGIKHDIVREWHENDVLIQQLEVTYTRLDDKTVSLPAVNLLTVADGLITDYQIYVDLTPVYA